MKFFNSIFKRITISYCITVCNEADELERLLPFMLREKGKRDELVVLQDVTKRSESVSRVINIYREHIIVKECKLNGDFASFKNNLLQAASGTYLFQIDADEMPQRSLIKKLKYLIRKNYKYDCFLVPRINIVQGISDLQIKEWNWKLDDKNRINFPDYQSRIFKLNGKIKWKNKVHEELVGWDRQYLFPVKTDDYCLWHIKDIERQTIQNEFYKNSF